MDCRSYTGSARTRKTAQLLIPDRFRSTAFDAFQDRNLKKRSPFQEVIERIH